MKITVIATLLAIAPALGFAMGCSGGHDAAMSCADGTMWHAESETCVPLVAS
ncbi:MAG: carbohydrate-binding module family 14 protein [Pseudomonadota bacterium]